MGKVIVVNTIGLALLAVLYWIGVVPVFLRVDVSHVLPLYAAFVLIGVVMAFVGAWEHLGFHTKISPLFAIAVTSTSIVMAAARANLVMSPRLQFDLLFCLEANAAGFAGIIWLLYLYFYCNPQGLNAEG